jgi:hypothetical protein
VSRDVGFAIFYAAGRLTADEVVFAEEGDPNFLGARTLKGLNVVVDPAGRRLSDAGPLLAAALA